MSHNRILALSPMLLVLVTGCWSSGGPTTYPVKGLVQYEGKPVEDATVTLIPKQSDGRSASGTTNAEGTFEVTTYISPSLQAPGAMPGEYDIVVSKIEVRELDPDLNPQEAQAAFQKLGPPKNLLPKKYRSPNTSGLSVTIENGSPEPLALDLAD
ncbi:hypothetical protein Pan97_50140 [Bremerella volcania]|uniref:Carboxypeptidase regulatory-like domain-containing protein n=1 Tax=Bremerella volcania TaxID=2527984 RepID=A0A518CFD2_9BACT|nr:carboxypeptidase-like regulatory domain-containing protein [Bremerella volcania]QDU77935.1 hypothetical protein Pan97_50140 [Bremerella volcania]